MSSRSHTLVEVVKELLRVMKGVYQNICQIYVNQKLYIYNIVINIYIYMGFIKITCKNGKCEALKNIYCNLV